MFHIPESPERAPYSLDILIFSNAGMLELQRFMGELDNEASGAKSREDLLLTS